MAVLGVDKKGGKRKPYQKKPDFANLKKNLTDTYKQREGKGD